MTVFYNSRAKSLEKIEPDSLDDSESSPAHGEGRQGLHLHGRGRPANRIDPFDGCHSLKGEATCEK